MAKIKLDRKDIKKLLPHRFWMLFISSAIYEEGSKEIIAYKKISWWRDFPFLFGHFFTEVFYPGVCQYECFNQAAALLVKLMNPTSVNGLPKVVGYEGIKHLTPVKAGDYLEIHVQLDKAKMGVYFFSGEISKRDARGLLRAVEIKKMQGVADAPKSK
ncbi:MAG: 3-hydroxyacyl-[acyl-carrier-protein] dehydratase FabZ [Candidatus Moranbacteria bacterium GW2011_GWC2_37_73]|nr:MAG: 3-hydroxyacyl-[acyl-carrier-protein] dehydratase FabZ [Parcubacteria group bacterium GW2011_GWC1_36_108]KKQ00186.1 MAG: 3-hydroxyacyl-[acyl-carrier-protein] dehydratase FabZ [Candidatus Moranbacteria bacterium GW2011_GWD1_36_198]KKQ01319.1 MAG: 3-hydroxyacyl-[acyl-carrier-protein] dehydratase FabZ [Candidatus Moranbacteria bacterium GW2011_GWD2_36_198]KKQ39763.1 MAG: 3-hydroxyacyl-[acyl-carrier-protein] dehydratase FabZ [Candidatus Moranbacteria bacterium GW2011_GWC2_37_73]HAR99780.1 hy